MASYNGGKGGSGVCQALINMMPPHDRYIEAFLGSGAVMRAKKPARFNIGIERDDLVASSFFAKSLRCLERDLPYYREIPCANTVDGNTVIVGDACAVLAQGVSYVATDLIYCDPPYLPETRSSIRPLYRYEMSRDDHVELLNVLLRINARYGGPMIMISGYDSSLYNEMLAGWRVETFTSVKRSGAVATETVWLNFPPPAALHDYRFLGSNFRERERIKRKKTRWSTRLAAMDPLERYAILSAIEELK